MTPLAAIAAALLYSVWSNHMFKGPLVFSSSLLILGNFLYSIAYEFQNIWLVLIGRLLCGLGGARALNRRFISDTIPIKRRTQACAAFVAGSALGVAFGPALAAGKTFFLSFFFILSLL